MHEALPTSSNAQGRMKPLLITLWMRGRERQPLTPNDLLKYLFSHKHVSDGNLYVW